jgi:hypothetical protein
VADVLPLPVPEGSSARAAAAAARRDGGGVALGDDGGLAAGGLLAPSNGVADADSADGADAALAAVDVVAIDAFAVSEPSARALTGSSPTSRLQSPNVT